MIETPTVFVVGAGGGVPYGLPTGYGLRRRIMRAIYHRGNEEKEENDDLTLRSAVDKALGEINSLRPLGPALQGTSPLSIDALLERRPDLQEVGKAAIAATLLRDEYLSDFTIEKGDWLGYLYLRIHCDYDLFADNQISFITFNYDRLIEHRLTLALSSHHGKSKEEAWVRVREIPIIHVYGQLGEYSPVQSESAVEFTNIHELSHLDKSVADARTPERIKQAAAGIYLINERDESPNSIIAAKDVLRKAQRIFFLGFGFDETNVARISTTLDTQLRRVRIVGSALGLFKGELSDTRALVTTSFKGSITGTTDKVEAFPEHRLSLEEDLDCLGALRAFSDLLH